MIQIFLLFKNIRDASRVQEHSRWIKIFKKVLEITKLEYKTWRSELLYYSKTRRDQEELKYIVEKQV